MEGLGRTLMIAGAVLLAAGLALQLHPQLPLLGKLPGDLRIERPGFSLHVPITSCLLVSALVSLGLSLVARLRS